MIRLVSDNEAYEVQYEGATFKYRRIPSSVQKGYEAKHVKRGQVDTRAVGELVLQYCLLGWTGVGAGQGDEYEETPYDPKYIKRLPETVKTFLIGKFYEADPESDPDSVDELGNLKGSSTDNSVGE